MKNKELIISFVSAVAAYSACVPSVQWVAYSLTPEISAESITADGKTSESIEYIGEDEYTLHVGETLDTSKLVHIPNDELFTVKIEYDDSSIVTGGEGGLLNLPKLTAVSAGTTTIHFLVGTPNSGGIGEYITINVIEPVSATTTTTTATTTTTTTEPVYKMQIIPENISMVKGDTSKLIAFNAPNGETVKWVSDNTGIATVENGTVKAVSAGTAEIYAVCGNEMASCTVTVTDNAILYGDANLDGKVSISDAVAVLQYIANKGKYPIEGQAAANADVYGNGDGITGKDAAAIQKYDAGVIKSLPEK